MAKTAVNTMVTRLKRRLDYNIIDDDLTNLLIDCINDALKLIYQWLFDAGDFIDIGSSDGTNIKTTASQAYIDISTHLASADKIVRLSERTNDKPIGLIDYFDFIAKYPDPTANTSATPDEAAIWSNRLYLGPTPSASDLVIYAEYVAIPTDVAAGGTLPYKTKYDPLVLATARCEYLRFFDANNVATIRIAEQAMEFYKNTLITQATKDLGMNKQTASRREGRIWAPRVPES